MEINQKIRIGMLTPSSNSIVEPWCYKIIGTIENASVHFGRVEVLWIDDDTASLSQFYDENMIKGFDLLSHVKPMVLGTFCSIFEARNLGNRLRALIVRQNPYSQRPVWGTSPGPPKTHQKSIKMRSGTQAGSRTSHRP